MAVVRLFSSLSRPTGPYAFASDWRRAPWQHPCTLTLTGGTVVELELGKLFGLPAHPFLVHIPVVLTPLTVSGGVAAAVSSRWRRRMGVPLIALALVLAVATQLTIGSGEALKEAVRKTALVREHVSQSDLIEPFMILFLVSLCGLVLFDRWRRGELLPARLSRIKARTTRLLFVLAALATVVSGGAATALVIRAGHSGARATWQKNPQIVRPIDG